MELPDQEKRNQDRIKQIESEIDSACLDNPLFDLSFEEAAWYLLAQLEDQLLISQLHNMPRQHCAAEADMFVCSLRYPFQWLNDRCEKGGSYNPEYSDQAYGNALDLLKELRGYQQYTAIFPLYYRNKVSVVPITNNRRLEVIRDTNSDYRYEAYNRLFSFEYSQIPDVKFSQDLMKQVSERVELHPRGFRIKWSHRILKKAMPTTDTIMRNAYTLDSTWSLSHFSFSEFRVVSTALRTICYLWSFIRLRLVYEGMPGLGYTTSLVIAERQRLIALINRATKLRNKNTVAAIIDYMTFGKCGVRVLDPALQPIIQVSKTHLAIAPQFYCSLSPERNLVVLANQIPEDKKIYASLTESKEVKMRNELSNSVAANGWVEKTGTFKTSNRQKHQLDWALIDHATKTVLVTELKWFIEPAEVRELHEKNSELEKGVEQALLRAECLRQDAKVQKWFGIDDNYQVFAAVISANSIGDWFVQHQNCPIIRQQHIQNRIATECSLIEICRWLHERKYLPDEGLHYTVEPVPFSAGGWRSEWYGIKATDKPFQITFGNQQ